MISCCLQAFCTHSRVASLARHMQLGLCLGSAGEPVRARHPSDSSPALKSWAGAEPEEGALMHPSLCAEAGFGDRVSACCFSDDGLVAGLAGCG